MIRAAYGIYYSGEQNRGGFVPLDENPPYNEDIKFTGPTFTPNGYVTNLSTGFPTNIYNLAIPSSRNLHGVAPDLDNPRVMKWNVAIQKELPGNMAFELSYLGNLMSHLLVVWDPNMPPNSPNVLVSQATLNSLRANPALGGFPNYLNSFGYGNYNALGAKLEKRVSKGLQFTAAYTWGHALAAAPTGSYAQGNVAAPNATDMNSIYASSPWDIRQNFVASAIYDLPFGKGKTFGNNWNGALNGILGGWQINGLYTAHTGHVVTLNTSLGVGYLGYYHGSSYYYASVVPGASANAAPPGGRTPNEWFNVSNIVAPAPYTQGNLNNATNTLPDILNLDFSLFKEFPFRERYKIIFRGEVFNLTNTPEFASMGTTLGVGGFGSLLTTNLGSQRRFQLGLKLTFLRAPNPPGGDHRRRSFGLVIRWSAGGVYESPAISFGRREHGCLARRYSARRVAPERQPGRTGVSPHVVQPGRSGGPPRVSTHRRWSSRSAAIVIARPTAPRAAGNPEFPLEMRTMLVLSNGLGRDAVWPPDGTCQAEKNGARRSF